MNENNDFIKCIYQEEMSNLGIVVECCKDLTLRKKRYCKDHNKCKNCGLFTKERKVSYCPKCICSYKLCKNMKLNDKEDCGNHICSECKKEKHPYDEFCESCICPIEKCTKARFQKRGGCYSHTCSICHKVRSGNGLGNCTNKSCKCKMCYKEKVNDVVCYKHMCTTCNKLDLYKGATTFLSGPDIYDNVLHVIVESSHPEIRLGMQRPDYCPNTEVIKCIATECGFVKATNCTKFIVKEDFREICYNCEQVNKCKKCKYRMISNDKEVLYLGNYCEHCALYGNCINCENKWHHLSDDHHQHLCDKCIISMKFCNDCNKAFPNNTLSFLDYDKKSDNKCVECIVHDKYTDKYVDNNYTIGKFKKAAYICWNYNNKDRLVLDVDKVYEKFNPNKISYSSIFELLLILHHELNSRELFMDILISFLGMKSNELFNKRLSKISGCILIDNNKVNLLSIFARCSMLPREIWLMVLDYL